MDLRNLNNCETNAIPVGASNPTLTQQLQGRKADLESRLAEINSALDALKKNPEIEGLLNLIAKVRY